MSIVLGSPSSVQTNTDTGFALKTASLAKDQQELEGQMAIKLIQTADLSNVPAPSGNSGSQVNIKV
ncbi:hypothetical protein [Litorilituus lipolyticus]|uniref:Motility protein n=1 Tax=Litorilituus lipolyticus TaxID=2491017 RepID=A0A502KT18_9GAMM|nr:hypothetical protein [Litorilituus lipolyticus]TPH12773.1 hypothetical protein EPA86_15180 [Litorilituus lipolyticus]